MGCEINRLNHEFLDQEWQKVRAMLESGLMYCEGEIDISQLRMSCANGSASIMVCIDDGKIVGALAIETVHYPNFKAANVISAGGKGIYNPVFWEKLALWLKSMGFSKVQGYCRPSVSRLLQKIPGFHCAYELIRADIP